MSLPINPPFPPMEALLVNEIPNGHGWQYEPKWDGFRCLVFRDGANVELQSKSGQSLTRYFPELAEAFRKIKAKKFILDGEIAVPVLHRFSFDDLLQRIHPAESRVRKLAHEHPAIFIAFDLLATVEGVSLIKKSLPERRVHLEQFAKRFFQSDNIRLSPATTDISKARRWFKTVGGDLDGLIAKRLGSPTCPGNERVCKR